MDGSSRNKTLLIEFDAIFVAIAQLVLNLYVQLSIDAVYYDTHMIHNVFDVSYYLLSFFNFLSLCISYC